MPTLMSVKQRNVKIWIRKRLISTCDLYYNDQPAGAKGLIELFCLGNFSQTWHRASLGEGDSSL